MLKRSDRYRHPLVASVWARVGQLDRLCLLRWAIASIDSLLQAHPDTAFVAQRPVGWLACTPRANERAHVWLGLSPADVLDKQSVLPSSKVCFQLSCALVAATITKQTRQTDRQTDSDSANKAEMIVSDRSNHTTKYITHKANLHTSYETMHPATEPSPGETYGVLSHSALVSIWDFEYMGNTEATVSWSTTHRVGLTASPELGTTATSHTSADVQTLRRDPKFYEIRNKKNKREQHTHTHTKTATVGYLGAILNDGKEQTAVRDGASPHLTENATMSQKSIRAQSFHKSVLVPADCETQQKTRLANSARECLEQPPHSLLQTTRRWFWW
eukprot:893415-Amphidinium_carterae.1